MIKDLKNSQGIWISDSVGLEDLVLDYFTTLFKEEAREQPRLTTPIGFPSI